MRCPLCRQGELRPGTSDQPMSYEGTALVVKDVPALLCDTCREPYLDEQVTQRLLGLAREASAAGVVVSIRRYVAS
jgi:YgiT-type zinc finger domain-containing protein